MSLQVQTITPVPGRGYGGYVSYAKLAAPPADASSLRRLRLRLRAEGLTALAGAVAQAHFTHERVSEILQRCDGDRRQARHAATAYALALPHWSEGARFDVFDAWLIETRDLVRTNWHVITALAERLALNGTLGPADVCRVIAMADRAAA